MIDWSSVLLQIGIKVPLGTEQFNMLCPFHEDTHNSCSINVQKGVWICFRGCGQGSLKSFIQEYSGYSSDKISQFLFYQRPKRCVDLFQGVWSGKPKIFHTRI